MVLKNCNKRQTENGQKKPISNKLKAIFWLNILLIIVYINWSYFYPQGSVFNNNCEITKLICVILSKLECNTQSEKSHEEPFWVKTIKKTKLL